MITNQRRNDTGKGCMLTIITVCVVLLTIVFVGPLLIGALLLWFGFTYQP